MYLEKYENKILKLVRAYLNNAGYDGYDYQIGIDNINKTKRDFNIKYIEKEVKYGYICWNVFELDESGKKINDEMYADVFTASIGLAISLSARQRENIDIKKLNELIDILNKLYISYTNERGTNFYKKKKL